MSILKNTSCSLVTAVTGLTISARNVHHHMERGNILRYLGVKRSNRAKANRNTHVNEKKFKALRGRKNVAIELPDYQRDAKMSELSPTDMRLSMLKMGMNPAKDVGSRKWTEAQLTLHTFGTAIDTFVPPEDPLPVLPEMSQVWDGTKLKVNELTERGKNRWHNYFNGMRIIRKKQGFEKFTTKEFVGSAERLYVDAFKALSKRDKDALLGLVTEHAYEKLWPDVEKGSLFWELVEFSQPSQVVAVRAGDFPHKSGNYIAQITVKMNIVVKRALYDRFGRLLLGNPEEPTASVEYVIFENHISSLDGVWRLHDKVYPSWTQVKEPIRRPGLLGSLGERPTAPKQIKLGIEETIKKKEKEFKEKQETEGEEARP